MLYYGITYKLIFNTNIYPCRDTKSKEGRLSIPFDHIDQIFICSYILSLNAVRLRFESLNFVLDNIGQILF